MSINVNDSTTQTFSVQAPAANTLPYLLCDNGGLMAYVPDESTADRLADLLTKDRAATVAALIKILDRMHGSGIDCLWELADGHKVGQIVASNSYHVMNTHGMYVGYLDFSLVFDCDGRLLDVEISEDAVTRMEQANMAEDETDDDGEPVCLVCIDDLSDYIHETYTSVNASMGGQFDA